MMTLIAAAAAAAAQPATAPANSPAQQHAMPMADHAEHAGKEECCCKDMAKHEGHGSEHSEHGAHQQ